MLSNPLILLLLALNLSYALHSEADAVNSTSDVMSHVTAKVDTTARSLQQCENDPDNGGGFRFNAINEKQRSCAWLARKLVRINKYCSVSDVRKACQATCDYCDYGK